MFIVSGTKRSGTSMLMQALAAAGVEVIGAAFPGKWGEGALRDANPDGFYEGQYRDGIFFATNPDPNTGHYLTPEAGRGKATKVFIPGVVRTELGHIDAVLANVRDWREYEASVNRLWDLDDEQRRQEERPDLELQRVPAALEWWSENYALLRDHFTRGYPLFLQTYDQMLTDPRTYLGRALDFLGAGDLDAAVAAIKPSRRTQRRPESTSVEPEVADLFDDLYAAVAAGKPIPKALWSRMTEAHHQLAPRLTQAKVDRARQLVLAGGPPPPALLLAASMT